MNLVKQLRTWDDIPDDDAKAFHWLDLKTAEAADLIEKQAAQIEQIRQQLAAALAACELKDEALQNCEGMLDELRDYPITHDAIIEALAIQPDDSALKAWLGEPTGEVKKHTGSLKDMAIIVWSGEQPEEEGAQLYIKPKGLK